MMPISIPIVVVFPLPFGPRKPNTWPRSTVSETRSTATIDGNRLVKSLVSMTGMSRARRRFTDAQ